MNSRITEPPKPNTVSTVRHRVTPEYVSYDIVCQALSSLLRSFWVMPGVQNKLLFAECKCANILVYTKTCLHKSLRRSREMTRVCSPEVDQG